MRVADMLEKERKGTEKEKLWKGKLVKMLIPDFPDIFYMLSGGFFYGLLRKTLCIIFTVIKLTEIKKNY